MSNTFTSRDTLKTKLLAAVTAATTADQIVKLSRSIEKANLDDDADLESALDTKVSAMAGTATTADIEKLAFGVKKLRTPAAAASPTSTMVAEGSSNLYATPNRVRGSFSASGDLSYNSGTGVLSYTALPDALTVYATVADLPASGVAAGAKGIVEENKKLYIFTGASWVGVGLVDQKPSFTITPEGSYTLSPGVDTVIALAATDPQGDPITFSHVVSAGSLGGSTVVQSGNAFTITGSTDSVNDTAPFSITFRASDGTNITESSSEFTVQFAVPPKIVVGAHHHNSLGAAYVYNSNNLSAAPTKLTPPDGPDGMYFGQGVAATSDIIVIGAPGDDHDGYGSGSIRIYDATDLSAAPTEIRAGGVNGGANHSYGFAVAISSSRIFVSAYGGRKVYVYGSSGNYLFEGVISKDEHLFGVQIAANDDIIAIGSPSENTGIGKVHIYDSSTLNLITSLSHYDTSHNDNFGRGVAVSSDYIVVGAPLNDGADNTNVDDNTGSVYVYNATTRTPLTTSEGGGKLVLPDLQGNARFGNSVAISGDKIIVSAWLYDTAAGGNSGAVYVYDATDLYAAPTELLHPNDVAGSRFGLGLSATDDKILIGCHLENSAQGAIYVYDANNLSASPTRLEAPDGAAGDNLGYRVSIG